MATLIRNGTILTALDEYVGDIYCVDGRIAAVGGDLSEHAGPTDEVIDASGQYVFPGAIDPHTHFELPFMGTVSADDFYDGTVSALAGGTTTIIDFAIPAVGGSLLDALGAWHEKASKCAADYAFHMALTDPSERVMAEIPALVREHGVSSFKAFMAYKGVLGVEDPELFDFMRDMGEVGIPVSMHAENGSIVESMQKAFVEQGKLTPEYHGLSRPSGVEGEATASAIALARYADCKLYIVHLTCQEALDAVREARVRGQAVYAETCPQYLMFDDEVYRRPDFEGAKWVMSPPIRPAGHQDYLWAGLADGSLQAVATDHCPFNFDTQKQMGRDNFCKIPNGAPGIGDRMGVMYTFGVKPGRIDVHKWIDTCCTFPAKFFDMFPRKGTIAVGSDADIVIFDPTTAYTMGVAKSEHNCDFNAYEGMQGFGSFDMVFSRGRLLWDHGEWKGTAGMGAYMKRRVGAVPELVEG